MFFIFSFLLLFLLQPHHLLLPLHHYPTAFILVHHHHHHHHHPFFIILIHHLSSVISHQQIQSCISICIYTFLSTVLSFKRKSSSHGHWRTTTCIASLAAWWLETPAVWVQAKCRHNFTFEVGILLENLLTQRGVPLFHACTQLVFMACSLTHPKLSSRMERLEIVEP